MGNCLVYLLVFWVLTTSLQAQTEIIEVDSLTNAAVKTVPFDKPFLIKASIDAEKVKDVFWIRRVGHSTLSESIDYYVKKGGKKGYQVTRLDNNYFWSRKISTKNYVFISIADKYLFKPGESYFLVLDLKQTDTEVIGFFDDYYQYTTLKGAVAPIPPAAPAALISAQQHLSQFEKQMQNIYGDKLVFGFATVKEFLKNPVAFDADFVTHLKSTYIAYEAAKVAYNGAGGIPAKLAILNGAWPVFDPLTEKQLKVDASLNKDALTYLMGKDLQKNDIISDINSAKGTSVVSALLNGTISLQCLRCKGININSNLVKDITGRISNLDSSIRFLVQLQRTLNLLTPNGAPVPASFTSLNTWIDQLQLSRSELESMTQQRKVIEENIMTQHYSNMNFTYTQVLSGNSYLNFETRNKVLLTPDFGVVTPAFTKEGKKMDYGIVPYLGFHINLKAVDKDIAFKSYKKDPLQRLSILIGWSLVDMNKDKEYANFFEKSALLTGAGFRLNNVIRLTAGTQWLFHLGTDNQGNATRKLRAIPFLGLSFDLNVKQYLNGFVDLLSGIGKTKNITNSTSNTNTIPPASPSQQ